MGRGHLPEGAFCSSPPNENIFKIDLQEVIGTETRVFLGTTQARSGITNRKILLVPEDFWILDFFWKPEPENSRSPVARIGISVVDNYFANFERIMGANSNEYCKNALKSSDPGQTPSSVMYVMDGYTRNAQMYHREYTH